MARCYVSECIAEYCSSENETFCSECGENMYIQEDGSTIVECSGCGNTLDMEQDDE